jgi:hypothetical protein
MKTEAFRGKNQKRKLMSMKPSRSVSSQAGTAKKSTKKTSKKIPANAKENNVVNNSREQVAMRAYFIGERRRALGIAGDATSDWVQAEQELSKELKAN